MKINTLLLLFILSNCCLAQNNNCTKLNESIIQGNNSLSEKLIGKIPDVNCRTDVSPLSTACLYGNLNIVQLLIKKDADVNLIQYNNDNKSEGSAIFSALSICPQSLDPILIDVAKLSLNKVAKPKSCSIKTKNEIALLLIKSGANLDIKTEDNTTVLMASAMNNRHQLIPLILKKGLNIDAQNSYGNTALIYAVYSGNIETVKCLVKNKANLHVKNNLGKTAIDIAKENNAENILQLLQ
ncbi:ankyrin repeat domain-containing protein [Flavobacterium quisquiliarum]|uniref:Ankyrin repeat domain-containing protein n=1 Tax=Flavobacterium quisquiliarum TaxID=1834436 RepID=A0ABV8WDF9_9FLAO|nr:ankyrin repeat domain-containing protein [Flavobacterium quisquiliarum]MBW1657935.1 hypothetical protein [Flavobacterium quisquiliarum]NWL00993.1 hypothetical protein [Flavobacterium collinsii]